MHGDYHAANVMFSRTGPDLVAIVDWEMCTIGDPLLDLGWMLATWRYPGQDSVLGQALMDADGFATPDDLVNRYAQNTTRDLSNINWYAVLACFKLGIILEGSNARAAAGLAPKEIGDHLHAATVRLFERAHALIEGEQMIDFEIPGETAALRDEIRAFVAEKIVPYETRPAADPARTERGAAHRTRRTGPRRRAADVPGAAPVRRARTVAHRPGGALRSGGLVHARAQSP